MWPQFHLECGSLDSSKLFLTPAMYHQGASADQYSKAQFEKREAQYEDHVRMKENKVAQLQVRYTTLIDWIIYRKFNS